MSKILSLISLHNQTAIVTGSSDGIGKAIAQIFIEAGANVVLHGRSAEKLQKVVEELTALGGKVKSIAGDIKDAAVRKLLVDTAVNTFGSLNILVNNAGVFLSSPVDKETEKSIAEVIDTNTTAPLLLISEATPHLIASKGTIINVASTAHLGFLPGASVYSASKAALHAITSVLTVELGPQGVRVNTISPGLIPTNMSSVIPEQTHVTTRDKHTPLRRLGNVVDVAHAALYLASPLSSFITGNDIVVDGGSVLTHPLGLAFAESASPAPSPQQAL
jgi:NAD(P)-dependent dehydrogenase (short-subunit alcohol dehydrogenase family)